MPLKDLEARKKFSQAYYARTKDEMLRKRREFYAIPENRAIYRIRTQEYRENNRHIAKRAHLKNSFGLSLEAYNALFEAQAGLCAVCGESEKAKQLGHDKPRLLAVDHNHSTGKVRGLLCTNCNLALGNMRDSEALISKLLEYIRRHQ